MQDNELITAPDVAGENGGTAKIVYFLYLGAIILGPLVLIGVIVAYLNRNDSGGWVNDHYRFQIRTFWIGLLYGAVGAMLMVILLGWLVLPAMLVWWIVRSVKGLQYVSRSAPFPNTTTWLW